MKKTRSALRRTILFATGIVVVLVSPIVGAIPGPGGVFVFAGGLALMLQNSHWAQKRFVRIVRRWPRIGHYANMGLRRPSAARRRARDKLAKARP